MVIRWPFGPGRSGSIQELVVQRESGSWQFISACRAGCEGAHRIAPGRREGGGVFSQVAESHGAFWARFRSSGRAGRGGALPGGAGRRRIGDQIRNECKKTRSDRIDRARGAAPFALLAASAGDRSAALGRIRGLRSGLVAREDRDAARTKGEYFVVLVARRIRMLHAGRSEGHPGNGEARDRGPLLEQPTDILGWNVPFDHIARDQGRMARGRRSGDPVARLEDRCADRDRRAFDRRRMPRGDACRAEKALSGKASTGGAWKRSGTPNGWGTRGNSWVEVVVEYSRPPAASRATLAPGPR